MDDDAERLRRRNVTYSRALRGSSPAAIPTVRYLRKIQYDTASLHGLVEDPESHDNAGPAYLRSRAAHYRDLANQQDDPKRAQLFLDLAASFEKYASIKERSPFPAKS